MLGTRSSDLTIVKRPENSVWRRVVEAAGVEAKLIR